jgi:hypothetical protein
MQLKGHASALQIGRVPFPTDAIGGALEGVQGHGLAKDKHNRPLKYVRSRNFYSMFIYALPIQNISTQSLLLPASYAATRSMILLP